MGHNIGGDGVPDFEIETAVRRNKRRSLAGGVIAIRLTVGVSFRISGNGWPPNEARLVFVARRR